MTTTRTIVSAPEEAAPKMLTTVTVSCRACSTKLVYKPSGLRVVAYTNGNYSYEFFCLACYAYGTACCSAGIARELIEAGVRRVSRQVPQEFLDKDIRNGMGPRGMFLGSLDHSYIEWFAEEMDVPDRLAIEIMDMHLLTGATSVPDSSLPDSTENERSQ